jgi:prepilin-type N-terminal cleavage/methylation domain-containing protein
MNTHPSHTRGFSLIELMVVIAISVLLMGISLGVFSALTQRQTVEKSTENVYAVIQEARNKTILGENGSQYGVRFASSSITFFQGTGYDPSNVSNVTTVLNPRTEISSINLTGGTTTIVYSKLTGRPNATGTIQLILKSNSTLFETITIHGSGLSEVQ